MDIQRILNCSGNELELRIDLPFEQIKTVYNTQEKEKKPSTEFSIVMIKKRKDEIIRRVIYLPGKKEEIISKKQLVYFKHNIPFPYKFVCSIEKPALSFDIKELDLIRLRHRKSFVIDKWRWDFTMVRILDKQNLSKLKELKEEFVKIPFLEDNTLKYEFEIEAKEKITESDVHSLLEQIAKILGITSMEYMDKLQEIAKILQKNIKSFRQLVNQAKLLDINSYLNIDINKFYLADKKDGERCLLYVPLMSVPIILLTANSIIETDLKYEGETPLILDCELYDKNIHVFDILFEGNKKIYELMFNERYDKYQKLIFSKNSEYKIEKVPMIKLTSENFSTEIPAVYNRHRIYKIDGLIFTENSDYFNMNVYKWKPPEHLTIDFLIIKPLESMENLYTKKAGFEVYFLFTGISYNLFKTLGISLLPGYKDLFPPPKYYFPIQFTPSIKPDAYIYYHKGNESLHKHVGEFRYDINKQNWELIRMRPDKDLDVQRGISFGNDFRVAEETFSSIFSPLTMEGLINPKSLQVYFREIKKGYYRAMIKFNNFVKAQILRQVSKFDYVIDLASGKGQDMFIYNGYEIKKILFIDRDPAALAELNKRKYELGNPTFYIYTKKPAKHMSIQTIQMDLTNPFLEGIEKANAVVMNLAIHYLTNTEKNIKVLLKFIDSILKPGGLFIFTCFDGASIFSLLYDLKRGESWNIYETIDSEKILKYSIKKEYEGSKFESFGQKIKVLQPFSAGEYYEEYLVNIQYIIEQSGYQVRQFSSFGDLLYRFQEFDSKLYEEMTDNDKLYSSLYHYITLWKQN